jgi:hypothetical protein
MSHVLGKLVKAWCGLNVGCACGVDGFCVPCLWRDANWQGERLPHRLCKLMEFWRGGTCGLILLLKTLSSG